MSQNGTNFDSNELILSYLHGGDLADLPPDAQVSTFRHLMETLLARIDALQQNQAMQLAGVHDRLDAVELELPLIQEQGALRMRDVETRLGFEIEQAARLAVEEATAAATAVVQEIVQEEFEGKFHSLAVQMEAQRAELNHMRDSKIQADTRLNRAILDIERLGGNLMPRPEEDLYRIPAEPSQSPFRARISEHIRKAAIEFAPGEGNPLTDETPFKKSETDLPAASQQLAPPPTPPTPLNRTPAPVPQSAPPPATPPTPVNRTPAPVPQSAPPPATPPTPVNRTLEPDPPPLTPSGKAAAGFDAWKRQFMQDGEPLLPTLGMKLGHTPVTVVCPRCFSDRIRPATLNSLDHIFRLANFNPHRCRSCSHRFYKRGTRLAAGDADHAASCTTDALETQ